MSPCIIGKRRGQNDGAVVGDKTPRDDGRLGFAHEEAAVIQRERRLRTAGSTRERNEVRGKQHEGLNADKVEPVADGLSGSRRDTRHIEREINEERHRQNQQHLHRHKAVDHHHPLFVLCQHTVGIEKHMEFPGELGDLSVRIPDAQLAQELGDKAEQLAGQTLGIAHDQQQCRQTELHQEAEHHERRSPKALERNAEMLKIEDDRQHAERHGDELIDDKFLRHARRAEADADFHFGHQIELHRLSAGARGCDGAEKHAHTADFERIQKPCMRILGTQINQRDDRIDKDVHIKHHQSGGKQPQIDAVARMEQVDNAVLRHNKINQHCRRHDAHNDIENHGAADPAFLFFLFQKDLLHISIINIIIQLPDCFCNYKLVTFCRQTGQ